MKVWVLALSVLVVLVAGAPVPAWPEGSGEENWSEETAAVEGETDPQSEAIGVLGAGAIAGGAGAAGLGSLALYAWLKRDEIRAGLSDGILVLGGHIVEALMGPSQCLPCIFVTYVIYASAKIAEAGIRVLTPIALMILVPFLGIWLIYRALMVAMEADGSGWRPIRESLPRILCVVVLLGGMAATGGSGAPQMVIYNTLLVPSTQAALQLGNRLSHIGGRRSTVDSDQYFSLSEQRLNRLRSPLTSNPRRAVRRVADATVGMTVSMNSVAALGAGTSVSYMGVGVLLPLFEAILSVVIGFISFLMFAMLLVMFGMRLLSPFLQIGLVCTVSPLLIAAWAFPSTKSFAGTAVRLLLSNLLYLMMMGVALACVTSLILITASGGDLQGGISGSGGSCSGPLGPDGKLSPESVRCAALAALDGIVDKNEETGDYQLVNLSYPFLNLIGVFMSMAILSKVQEVASTIVGAPQIQNIGEQVAGQTTSTLMKATTTVVAIGAMALRPIGSLSRTLAGFAGIRKR